MTLQLERARTRRPITWLTLIGVVLLPVVIGGILVAALYNPVERLDAMSAAIVNEDDPVTIDGQLIPLGRQLTAGLVEGSDDVPSNLDWTISNADDAAEGLADGTYAAVITIPSNFSAAATSTAPSSTGQEGTPEQATIEVETAPDALIVDDAITAQVTQAAASIMGQQLSEVYLENVLLGFTTLGDSLGEAADGAHQLADGATEAADGAARLPEGATLLAAGASRIADGANALAEGTGELATGARSLGTGLTTIADKTREAQDGANALADGVDAGAAKLVEDGIVPAALTDLAHTTAGAAEATQAAASGVSTQLASLADDCAASGADEDFCARVATASQSAAGAEQAAIGTNTAAGHLSGGLDQFAAEAPKELAKQFAPIAAAVRSLADGLGQLAGGIDQSAGGAHSLAGGATQLQSGTSQLATGASGLGDGASQLADGAGSLADGIGALAEGTGELAGGLDTAVDSIPSYSESEATAVASVVASPVAADGAGTSLFGASAIPLLAMLALWFGGLATFVALRAVSARTLTSRAPSAALALRAFAPAAALGALQGLLVAGVVQLAAGYDFAQWSMFAGVAIAAGIAFAAVNQALIAVFGGAGRWVSALIGVLAVATGIVSTVPGVLSSIAALMPTTPAYNAMLAALTSASGVGAGLAGLVVWGAVALCATILAVAARRTTSARALLAASPA